MYWMRYMCQELFWPNNTTIQKCPSEAIQIINLPKDLNKDTTHLYGPNTFKLHRLPVPRPRQVLGLVGINGIGKSTALKVLVGKLKQNLGRFNVNCVLRLPQPLRSLSSQKSYVLDAVYESRNAHLKQQFKSSICQRIWIKMQHTDMAPTPSNCTGWQFLGPGKFLVWLEPNWEVHCSESYGLKAETKSFLVV